MSKLILFLKLEQKDFYTKGQGKYPEASERELIFSELQKFTAAEIRIIKNEIFTRHVYIFKSKDLATYFGKQNGINLFTKMS